MCLLTQSGDARGTYPTLFPPPRAYLPLKECSVVLYCCSCPRAYLPLCPPPIRAWWRWAMPKIHHLAFPFPTTGSTHVEVSRAPSVEVHLVYATRRPPSQSEAGKKAAGCTLAARQAINWGDGRFGMGGRQLYAGHPSGQSFLMAKKEPPWFIVLQSEGYKQQCIF